MGLYRINDTTLTSLADKIRSKTGASGELTPAGTMLSALDTLPDMPELFPDEPETLGQIACLARAAQMRDIVYKPAMHLPYNGGLYPGGIAVTGLPYSSVRKTDNFIGFNVSLHTFMTALKNPKSVLYTKTSDEALAECWYGTNCSVFVSYVYDMDYHNATAIFPDLEGIEEVTAEDMRLCDAANVQSSTGGGGGHIVIITGIERDKNGTIVNVEISESDGIKVSKTKMTYTEFVTNYINTGYKMYRNRKLYEVSYTPSEYIRLFDDEPEDTVIYSDLCTDLGDKATVATEETVTLNPVNTEGYTKIKLYRDGEEIGSYDVGDTALDGLTAGKYSATLIPEGEASSTSFIVADVNVTTDGTRYDFSGDGTPVRIVFKDADGYTLHAVDLTEDDRASGFKEVVYSNASAATVCVPFKNEYGFVVARCDYVLPAVEPETDLPDGYTQLSYIGTDGGQYIDTGVTASDYSDGIKYTFGGSATALTEGAVAMYLFGCLANGSRSGNPQFNSNGSFPIPMGGASSGKLFAEDHPAFGEDFTLEFTATSADIESSFGYLNGTALSKLSSVDSTYNTAMPSATIYLLWCRGVGSTSKPFYGKLYSFTMDAADGTPIRSFVPCIRTSDSVAGLYDTVGGVFYENIGTGAFTAGEAV